MRFEQTLRDSIREGGRLPSEDVLRFAAEIAASLSHSLGFIAHVAGLSPATIVMHSSAAVRDAARDGVSFATEYTSDEIAYLSPEEVGGHPATAASRVFSFGSVIYFCAAGTDAFGAPTEDVIKEQIRTVRYDVGAIPDGRVADIIAACLRADPASRPTLEQVAEMCDRALKDPPRPIGPSRPPQQPQDAPTVVRRSSDKPGKAHRLGRRPAVLLASLAITFLIAGIGYAWLTSRTPVPPTLTATPDIYPHGNRVKISWNSPDADARAALHVVGQAPPAGCPTQVQGSGTCTFEGQHDTSYTVSIAAGENSERTVSTQVRTYPQPRLKASAGPVVTDPDTQQRGCRVLVTAQGLAPGELYAGTITTRIWDSRGESPKQAQAVVRTDDRGALTDVPLAENNAAGQVEWAYGERDGWVRVELGQLSSTKDPWGCP